MADQTIATLNNFIIALVTGTFLYQAVLNFFIGKTSEGEAKRLSKYRLWFCFASLGIGFFEYFLGAGLTRNLTDVTSGLHGLHISIGLGMLFYCLMMQKFFYHGKIYRAAIFVTLGLQLGIQTGALLYRELIDPNYIFIKFVPFTEMSPILRLAYHDHNVIPTPLLGAACLLINVAQALILYSLVMGFVRKKYTDKVILFGVVLSITTVIYEQVTIVAAPLYFFPFIYLANIPEIIRETLIAQRRQVVSLIRESHSKDSIIMQQSANFEKSKSETIATLSGGVAHEINTPLTVVSMIAQRLNDKQEQFKPATLRTFSQNLTAQTKRISSVVQALLLIGDRKNNKKSTTHAQDLIQMVESFSNGLLPEGSKYQLEFSCSSYSSFMCNQQEVGLSLIELLKNSIDALRDCQEKWIKLSAFEQKNKIIFELIDSGPGIPEQNQERVKQPFFTTKNVGQGMGVGLSNAESLVRKNLGRLYFDFEHSNTRVCLEFPSNPAAEMPKSKSS